MKILVTGAGGLLGSKIAELATEAGYQVFSGFLNHAPKDGHLLRLDIRDKKNVSKIVSDLKPDSIIHCAALTNVDDCEIDKKLAQEINIDGARLIAEAAEEAGAYLTFISTDYVFDGSKGMYREGDETRPINFYGISKLRGEEVVGKISENFLIARPSVIYGARPTSGKANFALWLLDSSKSGQIVNVLADQYVSPTLNTNLAKMILEACEKRLNGTYHMAGGSRVSRYEFAMRLAETFGLDKSQIKKAKMSDMGWVATRPRDSSLDVSKTHKTLETKPLNLYEALSILKEEIEFASRNNR